MPKKGEKIRGRTPTEQALYDAVIGRLMSGESAKAIADEFGVNVQKLWDWKSVEKKRLAKQEARRGLSLVVNVANAPTSPELVDDLLHPEVPAVEVVSTSPADSQNIARENTMKGEGVKGSLIEQASIGADSLTPLRAEIAEGLKTASTALLSGLRKVSQDLERGTTMMHVKYEGEMLSHEVPIGIENVKDAAFAVKALSQEFAELHCIPHGRLTLKGLDFSPSTPSQHLHLHSNGGASAGPMKAIKSYPPALPASQVTQEDGNEEEDQSVLLHHI